MHVVDTGRASGHAGQTCQATVNVRDHFPVGRPAVLKHVLDQVNTSARTVEFIAECDIGRASRCTETAMHAFAQNFLGFGDIRIGELVNGEIRAHRVSLQRGVALTGSSSADCGSVRLGQELAVRL